MPTSSEIQTLSRIRANCERDLAIDLTDWSREHTPLTRWYVRKGCQQLREAQRAYTAAWLAYCAEKRAESQQRAA